MERGEVAAVSTSDAFKGNTTTIDFFKLVCGERLGGGVGREVYACRLDPNVVLKFERENRSFQNVLEWEFWQANEHAPETSKWLAPCRMISDCGIVLVQERTTPIHNFTELPVMIPSWATDLKAQNWGWLRGRPVAHDYGYTTAMSVSSKRLKRAEWWVG